MASKTYRIRTRVLKLPTAADRMQRLKSALKRVRSQKKEWPEPEDAELILNLHFVVTSFSLQSFHAEACLEIPVKEGFQYFTIDGGSNTQAGAIRQVIEKIENAPWFHHMKKQKVYFKVTGAGMEEIYRGYL